jgi:hypothetical protein
MLERVSAYLAAQDFNTAFSLLRSLATFSNNIDYEKKIVNSMVAVTEKCLKKDVWHLKEPLVILCGKIYHYPQFYNEEIRKLFMDILEKYDHRSKCGTYAEEARILLRIFLTVAKLNDKEFLPLLKKYLPDAPSIIRLAEYSHTCKDEIIAEGSRMFLINHLENLK